MNAMQELHEDGAGRNAGGAQRGDGRALVSAGQYAWAQMAGDAGAQAKAEAKHLKKTHGKINDPADKRLEKDARITDASAGAVLAPPHRARETSIWWAFFCLLYSGTPFPPVMRVSGDDIPITNQSSAVDVRTGHCEIRDTRALQRFETSFRATYEAGEQLTQDRFKHAPPGTVGTREERKMRLLNATLPMLLLPLALGANAHEGQQHQAASAKKEQMPWGIAGDARASVKTIVLSMTDDMRFTPSHIEVDQGQTVRFVVRNSGAIMHEFVIGTKKTLDEHAALMMKFPGMEHDEPYMTHVKSGASGEVTWTFNRAGDFDFACLIAGHFQAGMVGTIKVVPASSKRHSAAPGHSRG